ncbi:MAG: PfkB family carbohydrate kinase [Propionibacteriaceae bacterium]|jgi:sugar/nucleoside kinase (ribokinase family)|nr:PfkB family carbohydrate kinase [Propionibacteriaceae bacterium]
MNTHTGGKPVVLSVGIYILDILGRPITQVTPGGALIDQITITAAGTAGGTAHDLAALGMTTLAVGTIGDDPAGAFLTQLLNDGGVDTTSLTVMAGLPTSASILPIHPDGSRPAWHCPGASHRFTSAHMPRHLLDTADGMHLGGLASLPGLDGPDMTALLRDARTAGLVVTADCLGVRRPDVMSLMADYLPHVDAFMPNDSEALAMTGQPSVIEAARALHALGAQAVLVTCGADGMVGVDADGEFSLPAHHVPVVDSTGCGDAFSAGVLTSLVTGHQIREAAAYGIAAAALTLGGLGSNGGGLSAEAVVARLSEESEHMGETSRSTSQAAA